MEDVQKNSILILNENVASLIEYGSNKMLVHVSTRDFLIIHNWQVITKIKEYNDGNTNKYWIREIPGFNENDFPFIICNGWETFNLINVRDFHMEPLIKASVKNGVHQEAAFFLQEDYGFSMHFA